MDVSRTSRVAAVALFIAFLSSFSVAQSGHPSYDPATHERSSMPRDSFVDSTLKRINPSDACAYH
jgi:hypothetical protein